MEVHGLKALGGGILCAVVVGRFHTYPKSQLQYKVAQAMWGENKKTIVYIFNRSAECCVEFFIEKKNQFFHGDRMLFIGKGESIGCEFF